MKETRPEALFTAWVELPDVQRNDMDAELREIFELSCEKGFRAITDEADWHLAKTRDSEAVGRQRVQGDAMGPGSIACDRHIEQLRNDGFFRLDGFADASVTTTMLERLIRIARDPGDAVLSVLFPEQQPDIQPGANPEDVVSKIFRLARESVFHEFMTSPEIVEIVTRALGAADVDNFLSQFIFKNRGAWGQPWHQDSSYFPFERPVIGVWLAVTRATLA